MLKTNPSIGQSVNIRGIYFLIAIAPYGMSSQVIAYDEKYVVE
jgi:hypothetical protein